MRSRGKGVNKGIGTVEQRFPTVPARTAADTAIDSLSPNLPMKVYIDQWIETYEKAGGLEKPPGKGPGLISLLRNGAPD